LRAKLLRGFLLGDARIEPLKGLITTPDKSVTVSPQALDLLLHLASHPDEILPCEALIDKVWGRANGNNELLQSALEELALAFGEDESNSKIIEHLEGQGCHLTVTAKAIHFPPDEQETGDVFHQDRRVTEARKPSSEAGLKTFWDELQKRRVVRVGIGYLAVAWLIVEVADTVFPVMDLPEWSMKLLVLLVVFGFILTLSVSWLVQLTPDGLVLDVESNGRLRSRFQRLMEAALLVALLVVTSIWTFRAWVQPAIDEEMPEVALQPEAEDTPALEPIEMPEYEGSIAVLPFINLGADKGDEYIGAGIAEELLNKLARVRALKVAARTSSFYHAKMGHDIPTMAALMNVMAVLEGSFRREGNNIRVTAQLVDKEGFHLWSETYDSEAGNLLDTQSDIALKVARRTVSSVSPETSVWLSNNETDVPEAFDAYLQGLEWLRKPRQPDNLQAAEDLFEQSMKLDPRYTRALAGACETQLGWFRLTRDTDHFEQAEVYCNRALTLDGKSQEVFTALGNLYRSSGQYDLAAEYFRHALEINEYNEEATYGLARSLQGLGDIVMAERLLRHCIDLEPGYWGPYMGLGGFLFRQGRYDEAADSFARVTELEPDGPDGYTNLGAAYFQADDWEDAEVAFLKSIELSPSSMALRNLGTIYYYSGRYEDAAETQQEALKLAPEDHWLWGKLAAAYRETPGEEDNCQAAYRRAIELATERLEVDAADAETMAYLSAYLLNVGDEASAIEYIDNATGLEPEKPEIWYFSGLVNAQLGNRELALQHTANAVELGYSKRLLAADPQFAELSKLDAFQRLIR
jgi:TolB-like protein/tetratricopeptide (TPR) repeat protein/DNA-binding winged helix-turn-helix (wHTH) protein